MNGLTVEELIAALQEMPPKSLVVAHDQDGDPRPVCVVRGDLRVNLMRRGAEEIYAWSSGENTWQERFGFQTTQTGNPVVLIQ